MIRKILHVIFAVVLFVSTTGITVSKHYCSGKLVEIVIDGHTKDCCSSGCCHHNVQHFQVDNNFVLNSVDHFLDFSFNFDLFTIQSTDLIYLFKPIALEEELAYYSSPPPLTVPRVLSLLQVYRC